MKYFLLICLMISFSLSANPKADLGERKKAFDSKAKTLLSMQEIIISEKLIKDFQGLKDMMNDVDTTYRSGDKDKIKKTLTLAESKLANVQKDYAVFISAETKELMESYSSQVTAAEEKEGGKKTKPTISQTATKEKTSEYYSIAKADYANATKFERDGNLQYAIQLFKRALNYTVLAFDHAKYSLPAKYANLSKSFSTSPETEAKEVPGGTHTPAKESKPVTPAKK